MGVGDKRLKIRKFWIQENCVFTNVGFHLISGFMKIVYQIFLCSAILCSEIFCSEILQSAILHSTILLSTILYNTILCNTIQCNTILCNTIQCNTILCNTIQFNDILCNAIQFKLHQSAKLTDTTGPILCNAIQWKSISLPSDAILCNAIQYKTYQFSDWRRWCYPGIKCGWERSWRYWSHLGARNESWH